MNTSMTTTQPNQQQQQNENALSQLGSSEQTYQATFSPRFDIWEDDEQFVLYGDLPGVDPESLDVQFENRQLTIHGKVCRRCEGVRYLYCEYDVGDFHRSFMIGEAIDSEAISADLRDGVLTLRLPKSEQARPRRIQVKSG